MLAFNQESATQIMNALTSLGFVLDHAADDVKCYDFVHEQFDQITFMYVAEQEKLIVYDEDDEELYTLKDSHILAALDHPSEFMKEIAIAIGDQPVEAESWAELLEWAADLEIYADEEDVANLAQLIQNMHTKHLTR